MRRSSKAKRLLFASLLTAAAILGLMMLPRPAAAYSSARLIDDDKFIDSGAMSQASIQSFLNGKNSYLRNQKYTETCNNNYMDTHYAHCGKTVLASQIIYDAGVAYGLSPRVIMATMQKEESLITDPSPASSQINFAMGYACPDSGSCGSVSGFFNQVDFGTWQLRVDYARASGDNTWTGYDGSPTIYACAKGKSQDSTKIYYSTGLYPGNNVTFYDDYGTAYTHFVIANAATASLYCYTPHAYPGSSKEYYSGSYWFVYYYAVWWGNPAADTSKDVPLVGDWDGSGKQTPAEKRGSTYFFDYNNDGTEDKTYSWGRPTDQVIVGDFDGDGKTDIVLRRGSTFFFDYGADGTTDKSYSWGRPTDQVIVGDFDGDGKTDIALRRGNTFYFDYGADGTTDKSYSWGRPTDQVIVGDFDGDGKTDIALRRGSTFFFDYGADGTTDKYYSWGRPTDQVIVGDWYGSTGSKDGLGIKRGGQYFLDYNDDGTTDKALTWGRPADQVMVGDWNGDGKDSLGLKNYSSLYFDNDYMATADSYVLYTY